MTLYNFQVYLTTIQYPCTLMCAHLPEAPFPPVPSVSPSQLLTTCCVCFHEFVSLVCGLFVYVPRGSETGLCPSSVSLISLSIALWKICPCCKGGEYFVFFVAE